MFESLSRGWNLTKTSFKVLSLDKEILALPLMAGVLMVTVVLGFGYGLFGLGFFEEPGLAALLALFLLYILTYAIVIFFNAAVIEMATIRFNGGDPVIKDGLRKAWSKVNRIVQWAVVAATVGIIFRILRDQAKDSFLARLLLSFMETAWNIATFFVVPLAVYEDMGPMEAIKASTGRMKRTFGTSISGIVTTGIVFLVLGLLGLIPALLAYAAFHAGLAAVGIALGVVAVLYWLVLAAVNSAVDGIVVAGLYKYSVDGVMPQAFTDQGVRAEQLAW